MRMLQFYLFQHCWGGAPAVPLQDNQPQRGEISLQIKAHVNAIIFSILQIPTRMFNAKMTRPVE